MTTPQFGRKYVHPNDVVGLLIQLAGELATAAAELDKLEMELVNAKEEHTVAYTSAFLLARQTPDAEGKNNPQYVCESMAEQASKDERLKMNIADAMVKAHKRRVETIDRRISVGQTACKTLQAEIDLARMPTGR